MSKWGTECLNTKFRVRDIKCETKKKKCNFQKAEAALAYELQAAKIKQKIRNEEIQIEVVERRKQIEVSIFYINLITSL